MFAMFLIAQLGKLSLGRCHNKASNILGFVQINMYGGLSCIALRSIELAMPTDHTQSDSTIVLLKSTTWFYRF